MGQYSFAGLNGDSFLERSVGLVGVSNEMFFRNVVID